jgi:hypothetical protein
LACGRLRSFHNERSKTDYSFQTGGEALEQAALEES